MKRAVVWALPGWLVVLAGSAHGEFQLFSSDDPSFEAQQAAFLNAVRSNALIVSCVTFDDVAEGLLDDDDPAYAETTFIGDPDAAQVLASSAEQSAYSAPHLLSLPLARAREVIEMHFPSSTYATGEYSFARPAAIGFWLVGSRSARDGDTITFYERFETYAVPRPASEDGALFFVGGLTDARFLSVIIRDLADDAFRLGIDHVWLGRTRTDIHDRLWKLRWFQCDGGGAGDFTLQRDGTPVCGTANCPGPPPECWGSPVVARSWAGPDGIAWTAEDGALELTHPENIHVQGEAWINAAGEESVTVPFSGDRFAFWLNGLEVEPTPVLPLESGWNHLVWTAYSPSGEGSLSIAAVTDDYVASGDAVLQLFVEPEDAGYTIPAAGRSRHDLNATVPLSAHPAECYVFDHWQGTVDGPPAEAENSTVMSQTKALWAVFKPVEAAGRSLSSVVDREELCIDLSWTGTAAYDAIEIDRNQGGIDWDRRTRFWETVAQLPGDATAWRDCDADTSGDETIEYRVRGLRNGELACATPPHAASLQITMETDQARYRVNEEGRVEATFPINVFSFEEIGGFSFGFSYDDTICRLDAVEFLGDWEPFYFDADLEAETWACEDPSVTAGGAVGCILRPMGMQMCDPGDIVEVTLSAEPGVEGCCSLRFHDCLGSPSVYSVVVVDGESVRPSLIEGEVCFTRNALFKRGDTNQDGRVDIGDPICILAYLFGGADEPCKEACAACRDASDSNDDGTADIADPIYLLKYVFGEYPAPDAPFSECGGDPTEDALECFLYDPCRPER